MDNKDKKIKELKERLAGYKKAMVDLDQKAYDRAVIEVKGIIEKLYEKHPNNYGSFLDDLEQTLAEKQRGTEDCSENAYKTPKKGSK